MIRLGTLLVVSLLGTVAPVLAQLTPTVTPYQDESVSLRLITEADALCERREFVAALKKLDDAFLFLPNNVRLNLDSATKAAAAGDQTEVLLSLRRANAGFEYLPTLYVQAGRVRRKAGDYYGAITTFDFALALSPDLPPALGGRASAKEELDEYESALLDWDRCIAIGQDHNMAQTYFRRGMLHLRLGHRQNAENDFRAAIQLNPVYTSPYGYLGSLLRESGKFEESLALCDKAIWLSANDPRPYNIRSWIHQAMGRFDLALVDATRCIELAPDTGIYRLYRALLYQLQNDSVGAAREYQATTEFAERTRDIPLWFYAHSYRELWQRTPDQPPVIDYLGDVLTWPDSWQKRLGLFLSGRTTAETLLSDAKQAKRRLSKDQQRCEANYCIGMVNLGRGDIETAKAYLKQCIDGPPGMVERVLATIQLRRLDRLQLEMAALLNQNVRSKATRRR